MYVFILRIPLYRVIKGIQGAWGKLIMWWPLALTKEANMLSKGVGGMTTQESFDHYTP